MGAGTEVPDSLPPGTCGEHIRQPRDHLASRTRHELMRSTSAANNTIYDHNDRPVPGYQRRLSKIVVYDVSPNTCATSCTA